MDQIKSGLILLIAGMGMTFLFLYVQILCTNLFSKLSGKFAHLVPEPEPKKPVKKVAAPKQDDAEVVAAISAALHHHANRA